MSPQPSPSATPTPLWRHLWSWVLGALGLAWVALISVAYYTGLHEADEIGDGQLEAAAHLWLAQPLWHTLDALAPPVADVHALARKLGYEQTVAILAWDGSGHLQVDTHGLAPWLAIAQPTRATRNLPDHRSVQVELDAVRHTWRLFTVTDATSGRRVTAVTDLGARTALGRDVALHIARPALIVLPVLALLMAWALQRGLRPLQRLSRQVDALDSQAATPRLPPQPYAEFSSTVQAINALVERLEQQVLRERQFASDIAHELRTPLTALNLQAQAALAALDPAQRDAALRQVQAMSLEAGHILALLLDFARAQRQPVPTAREVSLVELVRQVMAQHAQTAHDTQHTLELEATPGSEAHTIAAHAPLLALAIRNLIDNALTHTPKGTQVTVRVDSTHQGWSVLVDDDGGQTAASPPTPGLGLGLLLTQRIAAWHQAEWIQGGAPAPWTTRYGLRHPALRSS